MFRIVVKLYKELRKKAHTQIHKLFFKPKHIWMIMEPCVALKRNICIYLIVYKLLQFYRPQVEAWPVKRKAVCFLNAFLKRLLPNI